MIDLKLSTSTHDLELSNGDLGLVTTDGAIRQNLKQRLLQFFGEWFLDTSGGVPYYQYILVKKPNMDLVNATIQKTILGSSGISELSEYRLDYDPVGRGLSVAIQAKTADGEFALSATVGV